MYQITKAYELLSVGSKGTSLYARWANQCEIGYPELIILYALNAKHRLTQKTITEEFGLIKATVSTVIRDLKKRGLIVLEASKEDRREKLVVFTEDGKKYAENIVRPLLETEERITKKIGDERMEQIIDTLDLFNILFEKELKVVHKK
ncbi:MarR family winged helix-turn-helix transcriptional regulator [Dielma fastidiosa]|uniref:MarR family transcriptional regulator n=1 Tax=Dielma fastidiosa TaxID=1034346 RepID=A0AB35URP2_9FIRM|nr:MarR family transcriptional regulator [Dielma fastidiosa]MDY5168567.1 MarR family transcriptional regulator [Dielma fastidiosa]RHM97807.1 MarR family transcriptional regulator [Dielma fastidiosa]